jgi:hypothetical protein
MKRGTIGTTHASKRQKGVVLIDLTSVDDPVEFVGPQPKTIHELIDLTDENNNRSELVVSENVMVKTGIWVLI